MKPCLILVDGLNIANRSIVAKVIYSKFPKDTAELFECTEDTPAHLYVQMMAACWKGKSVIIENSWRSSAILEQLGEQFKVPHQFRRMLNRIALGLNAQIALCKGSSNLYAFNWYEMFPDRPFKGVEAIIDKLDKSWDGLNTSGLRVTRIMTSDHSYVDDIDLLLDRASLWGGTNRGPGIGNWSPGEVTLIVGDRHGPSIQPYKLEYNLAFCDMAKAGSSYWLSDKLSEAEIPEEKLYWINAYDKDDRPTSAEFVNRLSPITILTLGDSAAEWCKANRLRYEPFKHPQYHKRFHYNTPYSLINRLKEIMEDSQ